MPKKALILTILVLLLVGSGFALGSSHFGVTAPGESNGRILTLVGASALVDSTNPCAFSVLLLTIAFLFSLEKSESSILKVGFSYIFGIFATYILIGLGILHALTLFGVPHSIAKIGAGILIAFGAINIINEFFPKFPIKLKIPDAAHGRLAKLMEKASVPTALVLGAAVGLYEFPCTGGPYLFVLGLLHDHATFLRGLLYLFFYNLLFVLPLVIVLLIASDRGLLEKAQAWRKRNTRLARFLMGLAMVAIGVVMLVFFT